ncbi:MAG: M14 metallopeptidase family protein [Ginsengibacter sp.]
MIKIFIKTLVIILFIMPSAIGQKIPSPKEFFGFNIGDNYQLANNTKTQEYFQILAKNSDRSIIQDIGKTEEGRTQYMMIVSSPANLKNLARYKEISQKLARAENLTDEQAAALAKEGKPVVWIDGGLHATETVGSQQLIDLYYSLLTRNDPTTLKILDNVIILLSEVNPDGQELVANWYMQEKDTARRNMKIPFLYNKYVGHDNNRDFYMMNIKETKNVARQLYVEWMPQIVYNHHQAGPPGSVIAGPPYRDPFNYAYDPLIITSIDGIAANMISRLNVEGKPGYTRLGGSVFNAWWNGGLRTAPYFHNMVGLLTEIIGNPTPSEVPLVPDRLIPNNATPFPVLPQKWLFKQSIDYSNSLNYAVLDYASRMGDELLENIYVMGKNSINKGSRDNWTAIPKHVEAIETAYDKDVKDGKIKKETEGYYRSPKIPMRYYDSVFTNPALRDPRGFIMSANQPDFPTVTTFMNSLLKSGVKVLQADKEFTVKGKTYPAGSYIVRTNQAFRPHVIDMFEPQNYPNDFQYPGGPPVRPYDATGWTLAFQMGVQFDRILDDFDGPFKPITYGEIQTPLSHTVSASSTGYLFSATVNNSFIAANNLLSAGIPVWRITNSMDNMPEGSFYTTDKGFAVLKSAGEQLGIKAVPASTKPGSAISISPARIALLDRYGGSMPSGWVRWMLEQFNFKYDLVYPKDIDKGNLIAKYDVILLIDDGVPPQAGAAKETNFFSEPETKEDKDIPEKFRYMMGQITVQKSIPQLKEFLEKGGNIVTVGNNTRLAYHLDLPVNNALVEINGNGEEKPLPDGKYFVPTSILEVNINTSNPANWGMPAKADVVFNNSPVFNIEPLAKNIQVLASFGNKNALRSGWGWGQSYLRNGVSAFVAEVGKGKFYAFGPEITNRAQSHGTFKMLFNELYKTK